MAGKGTPQRVMVRTPDGVVGSVDAADVDHLPEGAQVLTKEELTERKLDEDYAKKSTGMKVAEAVLGGGIGPGHEAFLQSGKSAFTAGVNQAITREALDLAGPKGAGKKYAEHLADLEEGKPGASTAGTVAGTVGGLAVGVAGGGSAGAGAARLLPSNLVSAAGAPAEHLVTRSLAGLGTKGALGKAAQTGAGLAVRGVVEGTALSGLEVGAKSVTHDTPITGEKLYGALGHGALTGGGLGLALGVSGSLVASGARGLMSRVGRRIGEGGGGGESGAPAVAETGLPPGRQRVVLDQATLDAGLTEKSTAKDVLGIGEGAERRPIHLRPGGRVRINPDEPFSIGSEPTTSLRDLPLSDINPVEPYSPFKLEAARKDLASGNAKPVRAFLGEGGRYDLTDGIHKTAAAREAGLESISAKVTDGFPISFDPDAGLAARGSSGKFQGKAPAAEPAFRLSNAKSVPRETTLKVGDELAPLESRSPIKLPEIEAPPPLKGIDAVLANPNDALRREAQEQAWKSFGGGFGLQSTKFAKQANKYFRNGVADLGEVAIRHGIVETSATASPTEAAFNAAKGGTPREMVPKGIEALTNVGKQLGDIVDANGGRVTQKQIVGAIDSVAKEYEALAATKAAGRSIRAFGRDLVETMNLREPGSTASVQDLILQRRGIDQIAFKGNQSLSPSLQNEAKQKLRRALEDIAENVMDEAGARVPGELKAQYKTLKKDYHALSIINEALTDSAARMEKAGMFSVKDTFMGLLAGGDARGVAMTVGAKLVRERGNAAAAAFLSRHADLGTLDNIVQKYNLRIKRAAAGVLEEQPRPAQRAEPRTQTEVVEGKKAIAAKQTKAQAIVKWVSDFRTNPTSIINQIQETAASVSRATGPQAAESYTANAMKAVAFISAHIPAKERRDPLDPSSIPPLTYDESDRLVRATKYALQPETIFADFERGIITPEGLRAAKTFQADTFAEFQLDLQEQVTARLMRGQKLTGSQRLKVDQVLGYGLARPETLKRLQSHFAAAPPSNAPPSAPPGNAPVNLPIQQAGFDAVEARLAG
jgi:hypothetical protein